MPQVSVVYVTHRERPRFDWFADSLSAQLGADPVEVIVVDGLHSDERVAELEEIVRGRFPYRHVPPKPTPWNGPYRLTHTEYFAAASARNTGIVHATAPYVAFVDDCAVLMPGWWDEVRAAARHGYVVAGAYEKADAMVVRDGRLVEQQAVDEGRHVNDIRWELGDEGSLRQIVGGQLYGCSFGAPRKLLVRVNGLDELCDPVGQSDCQLGFRLERAGARILYSRRMLSVESMEQYDQPTLPRLKRTLTPGAYMRQLALFGVEFRTRIGKAWDNAHMLFDVLHGTDAFRSVGNGYDLATLTPRSLETVVAGFPDRYWFDGTPLAEL